MNALARVGRVWRGVRYHLREHRVRLARQHGRWWLSLAGLACVAAAAFTVTLGLGLLVAGAAFFVLEWRLQD